MSLIRWAQRRAAALRRNDRVPPLRRLARLIDEGDTCSARYIALCQDLGLAQRTAAAIQAAPTSHASTATRLRQALLTGNASAALELGRSLARSSVPPELSSAGRLAAAVGAIAPLSADLALEIARAGKRPCPAEPALLLQLGQSAAAAKRLEQLAELLGPQRWLLHANLSDSEVERLRFLNLCLAGYDLSPVHLRDDARPLSINNLEGLKPNADPGNGTEPLLSVVMTCYDSAEHLGAALRSVLQQQYRQIELIAVDDGSRDDTWQRLRAAAGSEPRLRAVRLRSNFGTYVAKNVGLSLARGEFVAFQDADDWSHPERFSRSIHALLKQPSLVATTSHYVRLQDDGIFWSSKVWPLVRWSSNSIVFRREAVTREVGAFDEHRFGSDSEFTERVKLAFGGHAVKRLDEPLIFLARRENSLMSARDTGLDAQGRSQVRIDYQEAWTEELLQRLRDGASLRREPKLGTAALIAEMVE